MVLYSAHTYSFNLSMKNICIATHIASVARKNLIVSSTIKHIANYMYMQHQTYLDYWYTYVYLAIVEVVVIAAHCSIFVPTKPPYRREISLDNI